MLIAKYYLEIDKVENFYELKYLRAGSQSNSQQIPEYEIQPDNKVILHNGQLDDNSYLVIENTGNVPIYAYTSNDNNASVPIDATIININNKLDGIFAEALSDGNGYSTLIIANQNKINKAKCKVQLE